jgi:Icc-related predicted phosphoesterase
MGGTFEKPEVSVEADLETLEGLLDASTIFVTHSPAFGILDPGLGQAPIGSRSIRDLLQRCPVHAHIHGHSHDGFGRQGPHFNVASGGRLRAMILDLDKLEHQIVRGPTSALAVD